MHQAARARTPRCFPRAPPPGGAAARRGGEHAYAGAPRGSSIAERRRAALEKTAEAEARRAADSRRAAARPARLEPGRRDGVVCGGGRGCRVGARGDCGGGGGGRRAALVVGHPRLGVAGAPVPRPGQGAPVCQKPTSTALVRGGGGPVDRRARFRRGRGDSPPRGGDASAEEAGDGTKTLTADQDVPRPPGGFNARLIEPLLELADIYETVLAGTDKYKAKHHKTVAGALRELDFEVTDVNQLCAHPVTGDPLTTAFGKPRSSVRDKIHQILTTGKLPKLETLRRDPRVSALLALGKIWGVGPETARRLYGSGYSSIDALRAAVAAEDDAGKTDPGRVLSHAQRVGLRHYGEFEEKMPRTEAAAIGALVRDAVDAACGPGRCGSRSRGRSAEANKRAGTWTCSSRRASCSARTRARGGTKGTGTTLEALVAREPLLVALRGENARALEFAPVRRPPGRYPARRFGAAPKERAHHRRFELGEHARTWACRLPPETRVTDREDETEGTLSHQKTETDARLADGVGNAGRVASRPPALPPSRRGASAALTSRCTRPRSTLSRSCTSRAAGTSTGACAGGRTRSSAGSASGTRASACRAAPGSRASSTTRASEERRSRRRRTSSTF